jgi:hypothetical protein
VPLSFWFSVIIMDKTWNQFLSCPVGYHYLVKLTMCSKASCLHSSMLRNIYCALFFLVFLWRRRTRKAITCNLEILEKQQHTTMVYNFLYHDTTFHILRSYRSIHSLLLLSALVIVDYSGISFD